MKKTFFFHLFLAAAFFLFGGSETIQTIYSFSLNDIEGKPVALESFKGKVILVVNTASKCGFTPQYSGLQALYKKYQDQGFVILGFPANNFLGQEPGSDQEIKEFCTRNYGVEFPMFAKISVKGKNMHPLYRFLTGGAGNPEFAGDIRWNFDKFLFDRTGKPIGRFPPKEKPESGKITRTIETALAQN